MSECPPLATAQVVLAALAHQLGIKNIVNNPGCTEIVIDETWKVAVNPHKDKQKHHGVEIKPYHTFIWFNGWPAGMMTPFNGCFVEGRKANEDDFIRAMARRIERETTDGKMPEEVVAILKDAGIDL